MRGIERPESSDSLVSSRQLHKQEKDKTHRFGDRHGHEDDIPNDGPTRPEHQEEPSFPPSIRQERCRHGRDQCKGERRRREQETLRGTPFPQSPNDSGQKDGQSVERTSYSDVEEHQGPGLPFQSGFSDDGPGELSFVHETVIGL